MPTANISNYALQYDNVEFAAIASSSVDLFITEGDQGDSSFITRALTAGQLAALQAEGRHVVGYVDTCVTDALRPYWEVEWTDPGNYPRENDDLNPVSPTHAPDWLKDRPTNGFGVLVEFWDPAWRTIVIDQVKQLQALGYSGVFLDDVAAYDDAFTEAQRNTPEGRAAIGQNAFLMMQLVAAVREEVGADFLIVANADPYMSTYLQYIPPSPEVTAARNAYFAAVDAYLLENPTSNDVTAAGINLPPDAPLLILQSLNPPRMPEAEAVSRGALYVAENGNYDSLGRSPYPSTDNADILAGGDGPNRIAGLGGDDVIDGGRGDDQLIGGTGADDMTGGPGDDLFEIDNAGDRAVEAAGGGTDVVESSIGFTLGANIENLVLTGAAAVDGTGNGLANQITGNGAANRLDGGAGGDAMAGGLGNDTYLVDQAGDSIGEAAGAGADTVLSAVNWILGANLESLILTGAVALYATGNELANQLTGNGLANVLNGGLGADSMAGGLGNDEYIIDNVGDGVIETAAGGIDTARSSATHALDANVENLVLTGGATIDGTGNGLANQITGSAAANRLDGGAGADTMAGGLGNDIYVVDQAGDGVSEAAGGGIDTVISAVNWILGANLENLTLTGSVALYATGNDLANQLTGNGLANVLNGGGGADTMAGGLGNDDYIVENVGDGVIESAGGGIDTARSSATHALDANVENLVLTGGAAIDGTGNTLANQITGNAAGNRLEGDLGADRLVGGGGNDIFVYRSLADSTPAAAGRDTIADFAPGDRIDLSLIDAVAGTAANEAFTFIGTAAFSHTAGELRMYQAGPGWYVAGDVNGDAVADLLIGVTPAPALTAADFVL